MESIPTGFAPQFHVHARPVQLKRSNLRSRSVLSSREVSQFPLRSTPLTPRSYRSMDSIQHLSQRTAGTLAPPIAHTPRIFHSILRPIGRSTTGAQNMLIQASLQPAVQKI